MILIKEDFLHYLWKYKFFATNKLQTLTNDSIQIVDVGLHNFNTGPDFLISKIKIGNHIWVGNVEIHVKSSDWYLHKHENDKNYENVILHVVWINDVEIYGKNNQVIPTLELHSIVSPQLLTRYKQLFYKRIKWINCEKQLNSISPFVFNNWLEVLYFERLEQKSKVVQDIMKSQKNDWESILFIMLTKNFGLKVNGESFFNLANSIDFKIIRKEKFDLIRIEALFFGQSGFLDNEIEDSYFLELKKEFKHSSLKYNLEPLNNGQFQFFRLRPNNFPTIRLAQIAMLYHTHHNLFSKILEAKSLIDYYDLFMVSVSGFWQNHYNFNSISLKRSKKITKSFIDLLIINTIIPIKFMYYRQLGIEVDESILSLIKNIKPEKNNIIEKFKSLLKNKEGFSIEVNSAFESQSLLQMKNEYCDAQNCLSCSIGNNILNR